MSNDIQEQIKKEQSKMILPFVLLMLIGGAVIYFSGVEKDTGIIIMMIGWGLGYVFGSTQSKIQQLTKQL